MLANRFQQEKDLNTLASQFILAVIHGDEHEVISRSWINILSWPKQEVSFSDGSKHSGDDIFTKTGIRTEDGIFYGGSNSGNPALYGYRMGTAAEALECGLTAENENEGTIVDQAIHKHVLHFVDCNNVTITAVHTRLSTQYQNELKKITTLSMLNCQELTEQTLLMIIRTISKLETLQLNRCGTIDFTSLTLEKCSDLTSASFSDCNHLTLLSLIQCKKLRYLAVEDCPGLVVVEEGCHERLQTLVGEINQRL